MYFKRGQIVFSKAGRDKGTAFAVTDETKSFVYISDGKIHPLQNPKRKNRIHLSGTKKFLSDDEMRNNRALNHALKASEFEHTT